MKVTCSPAAIWPEGRRKSAVGVWAACTLTVTAFSLVAPLIFVVFSVMVCSPVVLNTITGS